MDSMGSYCLTESNSGSDAQAMKCFAKEEGDYFVLNGSKMFISGATTSKVYLTFAKTGENEISAFIVPSDTVGISFGKLEKKMGWKS